MQSRVEKVKPTRAKISVSATASELNAAKQVAIRNLGSNVSVAGFRPGAAPEYMIEKNLDPNSLAQETLQIVVNSLYSNVLIQEQLRPVNNPEIKVNVFVPYEQLEFEAEVDIIGEVKLGKYKGLGIKQSATTVSTKEINEVLKRMQTQRATKKSVKRPVKKGDEVVIDFSGIDAKSKVAIQGADGKDYPLLIGSGSFIPGFEENLIGCKPGKTKVFDVVFPADYGVSSLQKKKVNFTVTIKQVNELKPPLLNDTFAKQMGPFTKLEQLKADVKKELKANKDNDALFKQQNDIVEKIVNASKVEIPEPLLEEETARLEREQRQTAAYQGMTWNEYLKSQELDEEKFAQIAKDQSERRVKLGLILGAIANNEGLSIADNELQAKIDDLRRQYATDNQMLTELNKPENQQDIKNRLLVEKTVNFLVENNG